MQFQNKIYAKHEKKMNNSAQELKCKMILQTEI